MPTITTGDRETAASEKVEIIVVLDRLRSAHNVGNIFRLADASHIEAIYTCGYTASPPHPKLEKTAMGTDQFVHCRHFDHAVDAVEDLKANGFRVYGVDTIETAIDIHEAKFTGKCAFVFGNEALGIQEETLAACDDFIRLSAHGLKNSINVSNCAAVVLFQAAHQLRN
ncbi:RNA methyltransferase [Lentisphaera marina]|uniref:RNA methyltransferase n=1 Tax=Lentisphaera marina TaxID=1111041 RepID=UPI00236714C9|nr:RNA methyltransferase [Lentisphaera marina]MDD7983776.1 RNA methyltransferase [Lentisphaera marina]